MTDEQSERIVVALEKLVIEWQFERNDLNTRLQEIASNIMSSNSIVQQDYETQQNMREQRDYMREMKQFFQDMKMDRDNDRWDKQDREAKEQQERLDKEIKIIPYSDEQKLSFYYKQGVSKMKVSYKKAS